MANIIRIYIDKTHVREACALAQGGFKIIEVHAGGLCLYSQASALRGLRALKHLACDF